MSGISLGNFVRERRQDLGLTQEQLAERVGYTVRQAEISRLERGRIALPRRDRLNHLAAALEVPISELLVASGWFEPQHVVSMESVPIDHQDDLRAVLAELQGELAAIQDLEQQVQTRTRQLHDALRRLGSALEPAAITLAAD
jgi:transcriptional regulator with XRE-family HTH domain